MSGIPEQGDDPRIFVVVGLSGAGKSTVLHVFEDLRLFTADGVPPLLVPEMVRLMRDPAVRSRRGVALGLDQCRSGFMEDLEAALTALSAAGLRPFLIFLEADPAVILRRYAVTRRLHPLEREGIGLERAVLDESASLTPVREAADLIIDTSNYSVHDLRRVIQRRWSTRQGDAPQLKVNLVSFGYKYGVPREADLVFDLRFLPNPFFVPELRPLSGQDPSVAGYVFASEPAREFRQRFIDFMLYLLPLYDAEGRYRLTVAVGCTGGRHRSVAMTEALAEALQTRSYAVSVEHRHKELG